jgi:hypothetical protein
MAKSNHSYLAKITINDQITDGEYDKAFLMTVVEMGALVTVHLGVKVLDLSDSGDYRIFRNMAK